MSDSDSTTRKEFLAEIGRANPPIGHCQVGDHPIYEGEPWSVHAGSKVCDKHLSDVLGHGRGSGDRARTSEPSGKREPLRPYYYGDDVI